MASSERLTDAEQKKAAEDARLRRTFEAAMMAEAEDLDWEISPEAVKALTAKYKDQEYPLLMSDIPPDISGNEHLQALQELMYGDDTTPEIRAKGFRDAGNECAQEGAKKASRYDDAIKFYTSGIEQNCSDAQMNSALHSNRAQIFLTKGWYVECVDDCKKAIKFDPKNEKAYYRAARASFFLRLFRQAAAFCRTGLKIKYADAQAPGGIGLPVEPPALWASLLAQCEDHLARIEQLRSHQKDAQEEVEADGELRLKKALNDRGVELQKPEYDGVLAKRPWVVDEDLLALSSSSSSSSSELVDILVHWPALLLYDEVMISETILDFPENATLTDQLKVVLPGDRWPDWDKERKYRFDDVTAYLDLGQSSRYHYKVDLDLPLRVLLSTAGKVAGYPVFHILATNSPAQKQFEIDFDCQVLECTDFHTTNEYGKLQDDDPQRRRAVRAL